MNPSTSASSGTNPIASNFDAEAVDTLVQKILIILKEHPDGVNKNELTRLTPSTPELRVEPQLRAHAINKLYSEGIVDMHQGTGKNTFIVKLRQPQLAGTTQEEQSVFEMIEEAGQRGIWIRAIRDKTGLSDIQLRKVLKALEQKHLVKSLKAVGTTRKCYILYNLEAEKSLTGGTFYENQQLDVNFVEALSDFCVKMLQAKRQRTEEMLKGDSLAQRDASYVTSTEVANYVRAKGLVNVPLEVTDVEKVLDLCVLDRRLERHPSSLENSYRAKKINQASSALTTVPCVQCPVAKDCRSGSEISPENCEYFRKYFDL